MAHRDINDVVDFYRGNIPVELSGPPFTFAICALDQVENHPLLPTRIVSLICPQTRMRDYGQKHLIVRMDDVET